jgi:hypothetical protein
MPEPTCRRRYRSWRWGCRRSASVVVPASMITACPDCTSWAAAAPMASLARSSIRWRSPTGGTLSAFRLEVGFRTAPPKTGSTSPSAAKRLMSLRIVSSDTPKRFASAETRRLPCSNSNRRSCWLRSAFSIIFLLGGGNIDPPLRSFLRSSLTRTQEKSRDLLDNSLFDGVLGDPQLIRRQGPAGFVRQPLGTAESRQHGML